MIAHLFFLYFLHGPFYIIIIIIIIIIINYYITAFQPDLVVLLMRETDGVGLESVGKVY
jgi:hypothetical protein